MTLDKVTRYLVDSRESYELLVIDDGSRDETSVIVGRAATKDPQLRLISLPENRGKGAAVRAGVLASTGNEVLFSDADLSAPIEELPKLRRELSRGFDIAIGSRAAPGADIQIRQHPIREFMGRTFNVLVSTFLMEGIADTQCGFKLFRGSVARELFAAAQVDGFAFDVEILLLARSRYKVAEVPIRWSHMEQSKVSPGRDAVRMFWDVLKMIRRKS